MQNLNSQSISEKYIDLLLDIKYQENKGTPSSPNSQIYVVDEPITIKKWIKYRLIHSKFKHSAVGKILLKIKRKLGIKFY